jgi:hypothetical protein
MWLLLLNLWVLAAVNFVTAVLLPSLLASCGWEAYGQLLLDGP